MKIYSSAPYYDNYDEGKQFYRILFRPGRAVQARELTQLQTSLQNQVQRFGQNIFKEGSIVIPGQQHFDPVYKYVKLATSYNSITADSKIADLVGTVITGQTTGIKAIVVNYTVATVTDQPTIYVKYTNSGTNNQTATFADGEVFTNSTGSITLQAYSSAATGTGTAYSVKAGVIFTNGVFAYFDDQTYIVSKYTSTPSKSVGFTITESVVTSDDDSSILDQAVGTYNYFAPGADRYKLALDLSIRDIPAADTDTDNYIELAVIENGVVILQKNTPDYNILNDTLAKRTFDESGNYTVRPYGLEVIEHLRTSNTSIRDGLYDTAFGGNSSLYVNIIKPGKAYVMGYEIENIKSQYIEATKARDYVLVNNGTISTQVGNYIFITGIASIPDLAILPRISLYNKYTGTSAAASGIAVGTARIRSLEYYSGSGSTAIYQAFLFDIQMTPGFTFEKNVKQLYYDNATITDFTANISPTLVALTGTVSTTNASATITGVGTRFTSELAANSVITINGNIISILSVASDYTATANVTIVGNLSGIAASVHTANILLTDKADYISELPYSTIRSVDPTNLETTYNTRRVYDRTLSANSITLTAGTDETFAAFSTSNYIVYDITGNQYLTLVSGNVTRSGSPTGKTLTLAVPGVSGGAHDVRLITTVQKTNSAADKKVKTKTSTTVDFTTAAAAQATVLSLGYADIYSVSNIRMSANAFGTAYLATNSSDITARYTVNNGQRKTHYDIGNVILKTGQPIATGPIRISFDYFTHSAGDYCSADSYTAAIGYDNIPSFTDGTKIYQLRDCLDFRPIIASDTFTNPSEFIVQSVDLITDYSYYIPRTDKLIIDSTGTISVVEGISSATPAEPPTPQNSMALYVIKQKPYVFDVKTDIDVTFIDNKRFTMRDIGRIENRVKNLEYYTTLSLLEKDTSLYQIKDSLGFNRFKNGFVVDNFTGHTIGNSLDSDYSISMDFNKGEVRPVFTQQNQPLYSIATSTAQRAANNYVLTGNIASLPYTSNVFAQSLGTTRVENINPFSVLSFIGTIELNPPSDNWFDTARLPDVHVDTEGNYSTLTASSQAKGTYGTVWNSWESAWYGTQRTEERTGTTYSVVERFDTTTTNDIVVNKVIIPKMRPVNITFSGSGLKPNTKLQAYFDDIRVTDLCTGAFTTTGYGDLSGRVSNLGNIITDTNGAVSGSFAYNASLLNLATGSKVFRLTDSPTNGADRETAAEAVFNSTGELRTIRNEIIATRNGYVASESVFDRRNVASPATSAATTSTGATNSVDTTTVAVPTIASTVFNFALGGTNETVQEMAGKLDIWSGIKTDAAALTTAAKNAIVGYDTGVANGGNQGTDTAHTIVNTTGQIDVSTLLADGTGAAVNAYLATIRAAGGQTAVDAVCDAYNRIKNTITLAGSGTSVEYDGDRALTAVPTSSSAIAYEMLSRTKENAIKAVAAQATIALLGGTSLPTGAAYRTDVISALALSDTSGKTLAYCPVAGTEATTGGTDPLAQSFSIVGSPIVLTSIDLYFYAKDSSIPMTVELRKMVNGTPTQTVVPFSRKLVQPSEITISDTGATATNVAFDGLVYLEPGEYAIVLLANSINYKVWVSQLGEYDTITGKRITEQPSIGVLFKSQNASTWTPDQTQDLKFKIYQAQFSTNVTGVVDFETDSDLYQYQALDKDPLEFFPSSAVLRIYHPDNGLINGSTVRITGINTTSANIFANALGGNVYGINVSTIENVSFTASNVALNSYTIVMPAASNVTTITRGGGTGVMALQDIKFDAIYPAISYLEFAGTQVNKSIKYTQTGYSLNSSFTDIAKDNATELSTSAVIPSDINVTNNLSGARPFTFRTTISSDNKNLSPLVDMQQVSTVLIGNRINTPSYATTNTGVDIASIAIAATVSFTNLTTTTGTINIPASADRANAAAIVKGTTITVANCASTGNNTTFRVLDILGSGANIKVYGAVTTAAAGNVVTVTNGTKFIAEEAATGGSSLSKYITKQIDFINPSTSINLRLDICQPSTGAVKVYYKTKLIGETSVLADKEYVEFTGLTIPTSLGGEFYEVAGQIDSLSQFSSVIIKIVLQSTSTATVPKCKNLRAIALA